jgi:hypothetical protein
MVLKNNKGITMAIVIMVMLVLFLIGTAFVSVSAYQTTQAVNQDRGMQAHYIARAGAEAALETWLDAPTGLKPSGTLDPVYLNSANQFTNVNSGSKGHFDITINQDAVDPDKTIIASVGKVGNIEKTVTVTINTIQSVIPAPDPSYISGEGFYDFTSGQINAVKGDDFVWPPSGVETKGIVKNEAKLGKGLKIPNQNTGTAKQVFEKMLFSSTVQVLHNSIILKSNVIVFMDDVDYSNNKDSKGALVLEVYSPSEGGTGRSITGHTGNWGVVIFNGVGYYFKDIIGGVVLRSQADIAARIADGTMVLITDPNELKLFLDEIVGEPLTVTSYSILWSK